MTSRDGSTWIASGVVAATFMVVALSGCSSDKPRCDEAGGQLKQGNLTAAAEGYADAQRHGDGRCADEGLEKVAQLRASSLIESAKGAAAEKAQDLHGAEAAYTAALAIDRGNADAQAGLRRVTSRPDTLDPVWLVAQRLYDEGYIAEARAEIAAVLRKYPDRTVPTSLAALAAQTPAPTVVVTTVIAQAPAASGRPGGGAPGWPIVVLAGLVLTLGGTVVWLALVRRRDAQAHLRAHLTAQAEARREQLQAWTAGDKRVATAIAEVVASVEEAVSAMRSVAEDDRQRVDDRLDRVMRALVAMRSTSGPMIVERYRRG